MRPFVLQIAVRLIMLAALLAAATPLAQAADPFVRAAALELSGEHELAAREYDAYAANNPADRLAPLALLAAANLRYFALNDPASAAASYATLLANYPESPLAPEAARRRGECLQAQQDWAAAAGAYRRALELGGAAGATSAGWVDEVAMAAADCYDKLGDRAELISAYEDVLRAPLAPVPAAALLYRLGACYESDGRRQEAAQRYAEILTRYPCAPAFTQAIAKEELIRENTTIDLAPFTLQAQISRELAQRDFAAAGTHARELLALSSGNAGLAACARFRAILAEAAARGDFTAAAESLQILQADHSAAQNLPDLGTQSDRMRQMAALESQAAAEPGNAARQRNLGLAYLRVGAVAPAIAVLERARDLDPSSPETQQALGFAYAMAGRNAEAGAAFAAYLEDNPNDTMMLNQIGYTYLRLGDASSALTYFKRAVDATPEDANAHDSYGEGLLAAGRAAESAREYERAVELDPEFYNSWYMLGQVYRQLEQPDKAVAAYERALELMPDDPRAAEARSALQELSGEQPASGEPPAGERPAAEEQPAAGE